MSGGPRRCAFLVPGALDTPTGGFRYDRRVIEGLQAAGWQVQLLVLEGGFPWPDDATCARAEAALAALPDGLPVVADGLAFGCLPALAERHAGRLRWLALVHHPLAFETGLEARQREALFASEVRALACARQVVVTSESTALALADFAVPPQRLAVVPPGTDPVACPPRGPGSAGRLLCVATLTPRKGHALLVEALAGLQDRAWTLDCVGSTSRDAACADAVRRAVVAQGLASRVRLHGEVDERQLQAAYRAADALVLASFHEGYGMVLAEALAHGLPVLATQAGAVGGTVPPGAGLLVPPGDVPALRAALAAWLDDAALRARLQQGARAAAPRLPGWPQAVARFDRLLQELAQ